VTIVVDTSVWIEHLRGRESHLATVLTNDSVLMHPFVIGELACGHLRNRSALLSLWHALPPTSVATEAEVLEFIERHRLMGIGLGYVDVHLLASTILGGAARLWTLDRRLAAVAAELKVGYAPR
jgi:hypothetical protein